MALRPRPRQARACELGVAASIVASIVANLATGCEPHVVDAFEPPREPLVVDELRGALRNLYTFDGSGTQVIDRRGDAHGSIEHIGEPLVPLDTLQFDGQLTLDGQGSYVDLPDRLISALGDATFEAWLAWRGGGFWTRIFDFGDSGGTPVDGVTYVFLTPLNSTTGTLRVAYSVAGPTEEALADGAAPLPIRAAPDDAPDHVAVVIDRSNASMRLHFNGLLVGSRDQAIDLAAINDVNNWLGRSNYAVDPPLSAVLVEFRIYGQALTPAQIAASFQAGPGALD